MFEEIGFTALVLFISGVALSVVVRSFDREEARLLLAGFLAHVAGVFVQVLITSEVYGGGDIEGYFRSGTELAHAFSSDFAMFAPEAIKLFFHRDDAMFPFAVFGGPSATGSLSVVAGALFYLFDDSAYPTTMTVALAAYFGKVALYWALRTKLATTERNVALAGILLTPSVVYWCCNFAKESLVLACLGLLTLVVSGFAERQVSFGRVALGLIAVVPIAMIKPYVLIAFSAAVGVWFYLEWSRQAGAPVAVKPIYFALALFFGLAGLALIGRVSPQFSAENLVHSTAHNQVAGMRVEGGSNYQLGVDPVPDDLDEPDESQASVARQLALAPLALPTALFRPTLFEVRNPMMALNALETTALLFLVARLFWRGGFAWLRAQIFANPMLVFCLVFTALLGTAVGLASTNMGSLSRYRVPFMPFYVALVLVLDRRLAQRMSQRVASHPPGLQIDQA